MLFESQSQNAKVKTSVGLSNVSQDSINARKARFRFCGCG